ncbi:hypothetical protein T459_28700 [Capsicum annuum]|uniref:UFSP1/2/DUB catalytic domain-containing protein n=1 Tax=Capsicum annuum TaxID=4072 RepID=A0A2G2YHH8_CAPAN|nr:hypothetical protein T459_28700 [Capsicum annuum]
MFLGNLMIPLFVAIDEEELVCSLLEDLIVLADRESGCEMMQMVLNEEVTKLLLVLIDMLVHIGDDPCWGDAINDDGNEGELSMCSYGKESLGRLAIVLGGSSGMTMMNEAALETLGSLAIQSQLLLVIQVKRSMPNTWERITMIPIEVGNLAIVDLVAKVNTISILPSPLRGLHALKYFIILGRCRTRFAARNSYGGRRSNEVPFVTIRVETRRSLKELHEQIVYIDDEFMCFLLYRVIPLATALVEIGDKDPSFIGSSEWIGAIELSFVLDKLIGLSCKIINVRSGAELPEKCRESALHFENQGTSVMIGRSYSYCNMLLAPSDAASGFILPMNVGISRDDNDPNDIPRFRCICLGYSIMMM